MRRPLVLVLSPWNGLDAGTKAKDYLRNCIRDSLARDEIPIASHAMYAWTEALYETDLEQRAEGIELEKLLCLRVDLVAVYLDKGLSKGMQGAQTFAIMHGKKIDKRNLFS